MFCLPLKLRRPSFLKSSSSFKSSKDFTFNLQEELNPECLKSKSDHESDRSYAYPVLKENDSDIEIIDELEQTNSGYTLPYKNSELYDKKTSTPRRQKIGRRSSVAIKGQSGPILRLATSTSEASAAPVSVQELDDPNINVLTAQALYEEKIRHLQARLELEQIMLEHDFLSKQNQIYRKSSRTQQRKLEKLQNELTSTSFNETLGSTPNKLLGLTAKSASRVSKSAQKYRLRGSIRIPKSRIVNLQKKTMEEPVALGNQGQFAEIRKISKLSRSSLAAGHGDDSGLGTFIQFGQA